METHRRSIIKAISFRIVATLVTMVLVLIFTHNWELVGIVGILDVISKLFIYYFHERIWNSIHWGLKK